MDCYLKQFGRVATVQAIQLAGIKFVDCLRTFKSVSFLQARYAVQQYINSLTLATLTASETNDCINIDHLNNKINIRKILFY